MRLKALFDMLDAEPFRPFVIELLNGRSVPVSHPENVSFIPNRSKVLLIVVGVPEQEDYHLFYPESLCSFQRKRLKNGARGA
ncbi:MAG: hypothetical protein HYY17_16090 [Planctomycetes bacterium]|nr:hypothetical protein [Planctomycetota bacterium]